MSWARHASVSAFLRELPQSIRSGPVYLHSYLHSCLAASHCLDFEACLAGGTKLTLIGGDKEVGLPHQGGGHVEGVRGPHG